MILYSVPSDSVWVVCENMDYLLIQDLFGLVGARLQYFYSISFYSLPLNR